jgi:hypothetical protein
MSRSRRSLSASLAAVALALTVAAHAIGLTWGSIVTLSTWNLSVSAPGSTAVTSNGWIHEIHVEQLIDQVAVVYRKSKDGGATWGGPFRISTTAIGLGPVVPDTLSGAAIAASGTAVDVVWREGTNLRYRRSLDSGVTWGATTNLANSSSAPRSPRVARDASKHVLVTWTDGTSGAVRVRASADGGVSFAGAVSLATTTVSLGGYFNSLAMPVIGTGFAAVVYQASPDVLRIRRTTTFGATWGSPVTLASNTWGLAPTAAAAGSTLIVGYAIYNTGSDAYTVYRRSTDKGATWGGVAVLSPHTATPSFEPVISYGGGKWRAVFERCTTHGCDGSRTIYRESTNGTTWSAAVAVSTATDLYASPAAVVLAGTRTVVVWTGYDADSNPIARVRSAS